MDLTAPVALVRAQYQCVSNRLIRDAGVGGKIATGAMLTLVAAIVALPGLFAIRIGHSLGAELATSIDAEALRSWNGLQATFTVGFALLGSVRHRPSFPFTRFGRYPITPLQLLMADLPASLFEVFPLLGAGATILTNVGLAARLPAWSPLILVLALEGLATMVALLFLASAVRAVLARHQAVVLLFGAGVAVAAGMRGLPGLRVVLRDWLPEVARSIPGAHGYAGLFALRSGNLSAGLAGMGIATAASVLLFLVAAHVHARRLAGEVESSGAGGGGGFPLRFGTPAAGIGRIFLRQLLGRGSVRGQLVLPVLFTAPVAVITVLGRAAIAEGKDLPEVLLGGVARAQALPLFALVPLLAVAVNPVIWMNQFGWDRGGLRTLLLLPIEARDLLVGKFRGLMFFTALQTALGIAPLFFVRRPEVRELIIGFTTGGIALIVSSAVGHVVSIRFPRGIDRSASLQVPLHLSWIPPVVVFGTTAILAGAYASGELFAKGAGWMALALALAGAVGGYVAILPRLATLLRANRERLIAM